MEKGYWTLDLEQFHGILIQKRFSKVTKGQYISKADYGVVDSPKKQTKRTQDSILSAFRSFFGRIHDALICFRDLVTFN